MLYTCLYYLVLHSKHVYNSLLRSLLQACCSLVFSPSNFQSILSNRTYGKYLWNFRDLKYMFLRLCLSLSDNILSSSYSTSLSNTVCTIFAVFILGNYPIILELFFMLWGSYYSRNYASLFCASINTELWTSQNNGAIRETEIINYLKINTE